MTMAFIRRFSRSAIRFDVIGQNNHKVNNFEKRMLVWSGHYKTIGEVPQFVESSRMENSRSKLRIRVSNILMVLTGVGCIAMIWTGKRARERGESVAKQNLDWHAKYEEEKRKEELRNNSS